MATNSSNCKVWTVTITTGMMAMMIAAPSLRRLLVLTCLPIILFYFLDSYYLGLEKSFRNLQNEYVKKLRSQESEFTNTIYSFNIRGIEENKGNFKKALKSVATWPMYFILFIVVIVCSVVIWNVPNETPQNLEKPLQEIVDKQDNIIRCINKFTEKYRPVRPVKVTTKSYNCSSFFKVDNVDSVQVKVYGNKK